MRRIVTVSGIVATAMMVGAITASADPAGPDTSTVKASCVTGAPTSTQTPVAPRTTTSVVPSSPLPPTSTVSSPSTTTQPPDTAGPVTSAPLTTGPVVPGTGVAAIATQAGNVAAAAAALARSAASLASSASALAAPTQPAPADQPGPGITYRDTDPTTTSTTATPTTATPTTTDPTSGVSTRAALGGAAPTSVPACDPDASGIDTSAAAAHGWGTPNRVEDFTGTIGSDWGLYDGPGHVGNGRRSPSAATVENGVLDITGDPHGTTEGMSWGEGQKYGRWEARVRTPAGDPTYHAVMLLWPDAENWPRGGEVDFMEISDADRRSADVFLHYGRDNAQRSGSIDIDATQWHDWAVEWTPQGVTTSVDGRAWWHTTDTSILPPGPMHMTIQLDWFPGDGSGKVATSHMYVDWVHQYPYPTAGAAH